MKLVFECSEYPPAAHGGIGTLIQILARGLVEMGHQVRVVGVYRECSFPEYEEDAGVIVWRLRLPEGRLGWITARRRLFSLIRDWCLSGDIDLIEVPDWAAPAAGWPHLPVPVISRLSGSASFFSREMGRRPPVREFIMERASIRRSDFVCANSRYIAERTQSVLGLDQPADEVIYTPVEIPDLIPGVQRDPNTVIFAGTLTEKKGVISLVKSWPAVMKSCPEARLQIWGRDGKAPSGVSMQAYLRSLLPPELQATVEFQGQVPLEQILKVFQTAGMAVLPSYAEGFALTPLHTMAAGCPTIYSTRGSGPELMRDCNSGFLVDPDQPENIARAVVTLLQDQPLARRIGARGREQVKERFSWRTIGPKNEKFYRSCMDRFARRRTAQRRRYFPPSELLESGRLWLQ